MAKKKAKKKPVKKKAAKKKVPKKKSPKTKAAKKKAVKKKVAKKPPRNKKKRMPRKQPPDTRLRHPKLTEPAISVVGSPTPDTPQTPERPWAGAEQKPGAQKITSRKKGIASLSIAAASVVVLVVLAWEYNADLLGPPFAVAGPYDFKAARSNVLELQRLALSEAEAGREAFFVSHIGCAAPPVWQDQRVLQNFKRMVEQGVEVKLIVGRSGTRGEPRAAAWPQQFAAKLDAEGLEGVAYYMLPKALPNHSVVAGSSQRSLAYICSREADDIYPTNYFRVQNRRVCEEWKKHLLSEFLAVHGPTSRLR